MDPTALLVENHRAFLRFLEKKVGDRALAEDIIQDAFVKVIERPEQAPADETVVPWFYRTLRNAAIDRFRRMRTANKAVEAFVKELGARALPDPDLERAICECVGRLAESLKPEYADALTHIDIEGVAVTAFAKERGLSASNAGVRVFRARQALKKRLEESCGTCAEHGCRDCTCKNAGGAAPRRR
jgi:RNA polymerase sigma-70 factor (ECF subfamily)